MNIDQNTKLIARFHTEDNGTGLNIYNPYFEAIGLNVVYVLFKNRRPEPLVDGMRKLQIAGAITAGFEHDPTILKLVDERSEAVELSERMGIIANRDGKLYAHYQGGEGLLSAILEKTDITNKRIVIVGAGTIAKTLVLAIEQSLNQPASITIVNRTPEHAQPIADRFKSVQKILPITELSQAVGDILVNAARIGSSAEDTYFTEDIVSNFKTVADVTFGDINTNLITLAQAQEAIIISGWDMFTHQAAVVLREVLDHDADIPKLRQFVINGLTTSNHGAISKR
ncbi:MAG: NAD(P)-binding domain-containing protein [Candidatus Saccharibacteria bacterium]|nr:NAD(P)-binding domain-containing protein [Candidatus Saccharibacteria bacterium]